MPGILNYKKYLETLQTVTELGNTFPSNQTTYTFNVGGSGQDGWTATISWTTLVIDQYIENSQGQPDFSQSLVYGYYLGGTTSQYTTGVISLPSQMYSGPILPASLRDLPITVVTLNWLKNGQTYDVNLALIQNWEPGVQIGSPLSGIDFEPITPLASTLTLSGPNQQFYGLTASFTAESDIPISLGSPNYAYLYRGTDTLVATSIFIDKTATFAVNNLNTGTYILYAKFGGIGDYGTVISNTLSFQVLSGIPLILNTQTFIPSQAYYYPGQSTEYSITVIPDPSYPPSGFSVTTTNRISVVNQVGTTSTLFYSDRFYTGTSTATITASAVMVDTSITNVLTGYQIQSFTTNTTVYTATIFVINTNSLVTSWDYQYDGRYDSGQNSVNFAVATTTNRTLNIADFPITISQSTSRSIVNTPLAITVQTTSSEYSLPINILAKEATSSSYTAVYSQNHSLQSVFTATIQFAQTGTYSIYASYAGDIGLSIYWANRSSTSNSLTHVATPGRDLVPEPIFTITRQGNIYTFLVTANTSTTLTNAISFYDGISFVGSATWARTVLVSSATSVILPQYEYYPAMPNVIFRTTTYTGVQSIIGVPGTKIASLSTITYIGEMGGEGIIGPATGFSNFTYSAPNGGQIGLTWPNLLPTYEMTTATQSLKSWCNLYGYRYPGIPLDLFLPDGYALTLGPIGYPMVNANVDQLQNLVANRRLQDRQGFNDGEINPNVWRLYRYYDGTNYNLNTTTAFRDILDPINTGTWQVNYLKSLNFSSTGDTLENGVLINFAHNSRIYQYDQGTDYGWDQYDIFRNDSIGDSRGYNVIGLNADMTAQRPQPSPGNPVRLYFYANINSYNFRSQQWNGNDLTRYHIDLIEYIGSATVQNPIRNSYEYSTGISTSTSQIWLFKFTPEVRPSDNLHKTTMSLHERLGYLPANTYQGSGRVNRIAMTKDGIFLMPNGASRYAGQYVKSEFFRDVSSVENQLYGVKEWNSRNINDPSENSYTDFCNAWFNCFANSLMTYYNGRGRIVELNHTRLNSSYDYRRAYLDPRFNYGRIFTPTTFNTATIYTPTNIQTATFTTTVAVIETSTKIAIWPGTVGLGEFYGEFNGIELRIDPLDIDRFRIIRDVGTSTLAITTTTVSRFGAVTLNYLNPTATGSVTFVNVTNNQTIGTSTVILGVANLTTSGYRLSNTTTSQLIAVQANYQSSISTLTNSSSTTVTVIGDTLSATQYDFSTVSELGSWRTINTISGPGSMPMTNLGRYGGTVNLKLPGFSDINPGTKNLKIYLAVQAYYTATKSNQPFYAPTPINGWLGSPANLFEYNLPNLSDQDVISLTLNYTCQVPGLNDVNIFNVNVYLVKLNLIIQVDNQTLYLPNQGKLFGQSSTLALV